jgi:general secretion pathway protein L
MMPVDGIIVLLPLDADDDPAAAIISDEHLEWTGRVSDLKGQIGEEQHAIIPATAIVPASLSTFRRIAAQGLEPKQQLAVAKIHAQEAAITPVQSSASFADDGRVNVATVDLTRLLSGLEQLEAMGLNVDAAVPVGALLAPPEGELWRGSLGDDTFLCSRDLCCPDDPALAMALFGANAPKMVSADQIHAALLATVERPLPNFIDGLTFRRKSARWLTDSNRQWVKRLAIFALVLSVVSGLTHWAKLQWAISRENSAALTAAQTIDPAITDLEKSEAAVDAALARRGIERSKPSMLLAIVWQSVKSNDNVILTNVSVDDAGLLTATLSAPDSNSINSALIAIQRAGYKITAKPRRDQSGATLVDLTVRAP